MRKNKLLGHLPRREFALLQPHAAIVTLGHGEVVFADDTPTDVTYFPVNCIISMIATMRNGDEIEYGCIGREGMLGLQAALSSQRLRGLGLCQLQGDAVRFNGSVLRSLTASGDAPELHRLLLRYAQGTINVLAQSTACNALHSIYERTARWLLLSRDRADSDYFLLTQEFLAKMLGVRRQSVNDAAARLEGAGLIEYTRGHIRVCNVAGLEAASCECYALMRDEFAVVLEPSATALL